MKPTLTEQDFSAAAAALGVEVAAIKAVCAVEAPKGGFLPDGRPDILFERHKFSAFTKGVYDAKYPDISNRVAGGYGAAGAWQHERLAKAAQLERDPALMSASWGKFQLMGFNYKACGFANIQAFINGMYVSEAVQLNAFVNFIESNAGLVKALRAHDWAAFARLYNGPNYAINRYDSKMAAAFKAAA